MENKCNKCGAKLEFQDHTPIGGEKDYWICPNCGEEKVMFGKREECSNGGNLGERYAKKNHHTCKQIESINRRKHNGNMKTAKSKDIKDFGKFKEKVKI